MAVGCFHTDEAEVGIVGRGEKVGREPPSYRAESFIVKVGGTGFVAGAVLVIANGSKCAISDIDIIKGMPLVYIDLAAYQRGL